MKQRLHLQAQFWNKIGIIFLIVGITTVALPGLFNHLDTIIQLPQKRLLWGLCGALVLLMILIFRDFSLQKKAFKSQQVLLNTLFLATDKAYLTYNFQKQDLTACNKAAISLLEANSEAQLLATNASDAPFLRLLQNQLLVIKAEIAAAGFFDKILHINTLKNKTLPVRLFIQALDHPSDELLIRIEDISDFRVTEDLLKLFQVSLDQAEELLFWVDKTGKITYANDTVYHALLYEGTQLTNRSILDLIPQWEANGYEKLWLKTQFERNTTLETQIQTKKGHHIDVAINLSYIKFQQHELLCLLMRDITQEKEIVEQVVANTQQFKSIFEHSPSPMLLMNKKGKLIAANQAICELLQYTRTALLQMQADDLVHPLDRSSEKSFSFKNPSGNKNNPIYSIEQRYVTAQNKVIWTRSTLKPFNNVAQNQEATALIILSDITQQKKAKVALQRYAKRLEESNKELTQFAHVVSHDLQEPLRMVASFLSLLEMRYGKDLDENAKEYIHFAVDGAKRMSGLIEDLLTYSRVNTRGKAFESVDCNEVLQAVLKQLQPLIQKSQAQIHCTGLPTLDADDRQLEQLFENLLINALKFCSETQPIIHIQTQTREHSYLLSFKDNGIGIEQAYQDKIFGVFQRLHTRNEYEGSGIGLAVCKRIVSRHNGRIWVESELNEGSTFYVELPKVNL